ncbi:chaplin family protein [Actinomadura fulvescens]|uniref:Chaplin domain-containing protein n=1 Tax=Actinomadura fulvescens TaxID=46160 RepID=A0ABN3PIU9_9ACTN
MPNRASDVRAPQRRALATRVAAVVTALAAGLLSAGSGLATADTSGDGGVGSGNQVLLPINLPITVSGNAVGLLGNASAGSHVNTAPRPAKVTATKAAPKKARHKHKAGHKGSAKAKATKKAGHKAAKWTREDRGPKTSGRGGVLSGNQVIAPLNLPITACGNAVGLLGTGRAGCTAQIASSPGGGHKARTSGTGGVLSGNQVIAPLNLPVTACGNAVAVLGSGAASCNVTVGKAKVHPPKANPPKAHPPKAHPPKGAPPKSTPPKTAPGKHASHGGHLMPPVEGDAPPRSVASTVRSGGWSELPRTGAPIWLLASSAGAALTIGAGLMLVSRRRRRQPGPGEAAVAGPLAKGGDNPT